MLWCCTSLVQITHPMALVTLLIRTFPSPVRRSPFGFLLMVAQWRAIMTGDIRTCFCGWIIRRCCQAYLSIKIIWIVVSITIQRIKVDIRIAVYMHYTALKRHRRIYLEPCPINILPGSRGCCRRIGHRTGQMVCCRIVTSSAGDTREIFHVILMTVSITIFVDPVVAVTHPCLNCSIIGHQGELVALSAD